MKSHILSMLAVLAFAGTATPAMADTTSADVNAIEAQSDSADLTAAPNWWIRDHRRAFICSSRNILGRTFQAWGNWRTPQNYVQRQAVQNCQRSSFLLIRRTCRPIGCHSVR